MINKSVNLKENMPELLKEWDYYKNTISPENVSIWSKEKVWWKCSNEHEWLSAVATRKKGTQCPYCSGKLPIIGVSDLATTSPELLKEWDHEKNIKKPTEIKAGSGDKIWWKCKEGHSWEDSPNHRSGGRGCPFCAGKRVLIGYNDLKSLEPEISQEWNYELNGDDRPENHTVRSGKKVWWKCKYGHAWETTVCSRTGKTRPGCPFCAGSKAIVGLSDLATTNPELLNEWNYEKNVMIKPQDVKCGSSNIGPLSRFRTN